MGTVDIERQKLNVFRMKLLGANVIPVTTGSKTLKDAINQALRDWTASVETTHYLLGSVSVEGMRKGQHLPSSLGYGIIEWDKYQEGVLENGNFMVVGGLLDKCDCGTKICEIKKVDPRRFYGFGGMGKEDICNGNGLISLFREATKGELEIAREIYRKGLGK